MSLLPLFILSPLLMAVVWFDMRYMRIPNWFSLLAIGFFVSVAVIFQPADLWLRVLVAASVFGIGFAGYCFRLWGGGDVKFLSALMLFIPFTTLTIFGYVFSTALLLGIALVLGLRRVPTVAGHDWKAISGSNKFPMGLSIGMAGLAHPLIVMLLDAPLPG
ncbi:prepilin peptidase [Defluviimonas aestuarii]|uniref:A24 family peptidase n=1 Tax=Albidovulum aestuarii TaxID=1130726 RepID=UPI00249CB091|nr:prepilin peptidase [Defluviimonas aestuarii]MDI3334892.1 prepilin peptidase [Defluviimonas aestuarii]